MAERDESDINIHVRRVTSMSWNESQGRSINPEKAEKAEQLMDAFQLLKLNNRGIFLNSLKKTREKTSLNIASNKITRRKKQKQNILHPKI